MEYMRIEGFLGNAISKLVNKAVETKVGFKPEIGLHGLKLWVEDDEEEKVQLSVSLSLSKDAFEKLIEEATK